VDWCSSEFAGGDCVKYVLHRLVLLGTNLVSDTNLTANSASDSRTTIGVNEKVTLKFNNNPSADWTIESGGGSLNASSGTSVVYTAPKSAGTVVVEGTPGYSASESITFNVVEPNNAEYSYRTAKPGSTWLPAGSADPARGSGCGSEFNVTIMPDTVSFFNTAIRENIPATNRTYPSGYVFTQPAATLAFVITGGDNHLVDHSKSAVIHHTAFINPNLTFPNYIAQIDLKLEWKNENNQYETFVNSVKHQFITRRSDVKAKNKLIAPNATIEGGWQGPWK